MMEIKIFRLFMKIENDVSYEPNFFAQSKRENFARWSFLGHN